jgi:quinolinate synthase
MDVAAPPKAPAEDDQTRPAKRIQHNRETLGDELVILAHHYQRDEVIELADYRGDSLQLARQASQTDARYIVFCGVHFMAEVAAILAKTGQRVFLPEPGAGCYLADTATLADVEAAWQVLDGLFGGAEGEFTPVTYVNSSADLKAFCGERGGIMCTSSNAADAVQWALERRPRLFFFPDQHLGRNTALQAGIPPEKIVLWDRRYPPSEDALRGARVVLWPGACNVHQRFRTEDVRSFRADHPDGQVIVHPECKAEVVALADDAGSTAHIIQRVAEAPAGTIWGIGTEARLVHRLAEEHPEQTVLLLGDVPPYCATMSQITLANLANTVEGLVRGELYNEITVDEETAKWAEVALRRMLDL